MSPENAPQKIRDEKVWAAFCHFSILFALAIGPLALLIPFVVWIVENGRQDKSELVIFHAKQAFFFQLAVLGLLVAASILTFILIFLIIGLFLIPFVFAIGIGAIIYAVIGGIKVLQGEDFRYFYIGEKVSKS